MKTAFSILALVILSSCGKTTEDFLYDKYDKEYQALLAMKAKKCLEESKIFQEFKKRGDFKKYYKEGTVYKVKVEKADGGKATDFIKLTNVEKNSLNILYFGEYGNHRQFVYTSEMNNRLVSGLANGACDQRKDFQYKSSNLNSAAASTFIDTRAEVVNDKKETEVEVFTAKTSAPLALILWSRTERNSRNSKTSSFSFTEIGKQEQCDNTDICKQATWIGYQERFFHIDKNAHNSNALNSKLIQESMVPQEAAFN